MILATRYAGDVKLRSAAFPDSSRPQRTRFSASGVAVTLDNSVGMPALGRAIRLVASLGASLDLDVFEGEGAEKRERKDAYPAPLLDMPAEGVSPFDWRYDVFAALEACENFCAVKTKARGRVVELLPIPMEFVRIRRDPVTQQKLFDVPGEGGRTLTLTSSDVFHVRGHTPYGGIAGVSRVAQHRDAVGSQLAAQRFEGAFFRNNARPDFVMEFPQGVSVEQGRQWKAEWDAVHAGPDNAGQSRAIGGGAKVTPVPVSMVDAQFLESRRYGVEDVGRIMDVHPLLLEDTSTIAAGLLAEALDFFVAVQFMPRIRRVEQALRADPDLFKPGGSLYPLFKVGDLSFASATTRATVQHQKIQDGSLLPDEVRAEDGRPPLPDGLGMIPQVTPVGGAPNPDPTLTDVSSSDGEAGDVSRSLYKEIAAELRRVKGLTHG